MVDIRKGGLGDLIVLLPRLRQADINEAEALFGPGKTELAAVRTVSGAHLCWTAWEGSTPIAMLGVSGFADSRVGAPWLFGSDRIEKHARALISESAPYIRQMMRVFPRLENLVDARNDKSIRWLKRCGFNIRPAIRTGAAGMLFHPFDREV